MLTNITAKLGDELFFDGLDSIASAIRFLSISRSALYSLMERGELREGGAISVQLVAVPANGSFQKPDLMLELRKIELLITPIIVRPTRK